MRKRTLVVIACLAAAVAAGAAAVRVVQDATSIPGRPACSDGEQAFVDRLATDPMVRQAPEGFTFAGNTRAQSCVSLSSSEWFGGTRTTWTYPTPTTVEDIERFYRRLGEQQGWRMARYEDSNRICGTKTVDGTPVVFGLGSLYGLGTGHQVNGRDAYLVSITYEGLAQPSNECEAAAPG